MIEIEEIKLTGVEVSYYIVCKRKLWLFSNYLQFEEFSDYVEIGKLYLKKVLKEKNIKRF